MVRTTPRSRAGGCGVSGTFSAVNRNNKARLPMSVACPRFSAVWLRCCAWCLGPRSVAAAFRLGVCLWGFPAVTSAAIPIATIGSCKAEKSDGMLSQHQLQDLASTHHRGMRAPALRGTRYPASQVVPASVVQTTVAPWDHPAKHQWLTTVVHEHWARHTHIACLLLNAFLTSVATVAWSGCASVPTRNAWHMYCAPPATPTAS